MLCPWIRIQKEDRNVKDGRYIITVEFFRLLNMNFWDEIEIESYVLTNRQVKTNTKSTCHLVGLEF